VSTAPLTTALDPAVYLPHYLAEAPVALAVERSLECHVFHGRRLPRPVLDLGCGDGLFAQVLFARSGAVCIGLDVDERELAAARRRAVYRTLLAAHAERIPIRSGTVRTVMSNSVLEHIPSLEAVLAEVHRILMPGGELLITVPTDDYEKNQAPFLALRALGLHRAADGFRRRFNRFWKHHHAYPPERWAALLAYAGLRVAESRRFAPRRATVALGLLVPAAAPAMLTKARWRRWTLAPRVRRAVLRPAVALIEARLEQPSAPQGGLVFLRAVRP
jgi:SAM-dependent methyltransferase